MRLCDSTVQYVDLGVVRRGRALGGVFDDLARFLFPTAAVQVVAEHTAAVQSQVAVAVAQDEARVAIADAAVADAAAALESARASNDAALELAHADALETTKRVAAATRAAAQAAVVARRNEQRLLQEQLGKEKPGMPKWVLPVGLGAAVVAVVILVGKK